MTAFEGLRVLEFTSGVAGPVLGMILADFGADVIRVESTAGPHPGERPGEAAWNRNKRSVELNPASDDDVAWLEASVRGADVCIFGHGRSLAEWGHRVEAAAGSNPELISVSLPAYLPNYTPWLGGESHGLLTAVGGKAARQSSVSGGPIEVVSPHLLYIHGIWAATCTIAALVERTISKRGQAVTVSGVQALIEATVGLVTVDPSQPDPATNVGPAGRHPTYRQFRTKDDLWISVGALGQKFEEALLRALGLERILTDPRIDGVTARMSLPENLDWCCELVDAAFAARPRADLLALIAGLGVPCGPVNSRDEWFDGAQISAIGMKVGIDDPLRGYVEMPGVPIVLTGSPGSVRTPAPARGQHNGIRPWPAKPAPASTPPRYVPGPLHGFRVINMGTFVASPYAGMLLSELGADVIKVEPYAGDPFRSGGYPYNRGMRSIAIDLSSPVGQTALHRLAATCDVLMEAMRPGVAARLGIDYETLIAHQPAIITQTLSAYGEGGPLSSRPGVDMVLQAESGMMSAWGGADTPVADTIPINDVTAAALGALTTVIALYHRQCTGAGQRTWDSLAAASVFLQLEDLVRFEGRDPAPVGREDLRGLHPLRSFYETADGWIYLDVPPDDHDAVRRMIGAGLLVRDASELPSAVASRTVEEALALLAAARIPSAAARGVQDVVRDPLLLEAEAFHIQVGDDGAGYMLTGRYAGFGRTQRRGPMLPPGKGEHSRAVLAETGMPDEEIDALIAAQVVHQGGAVSHVLPIPYR